MDVATLIRRRAAERSQPGARTDPYRLALCIEGGAMRGVVSAGMVVALEELGLVEVFDRVYGSSAGAMNGAFFLAGQAAFGTTIYYENINNKSFIDLGRLIGDKPIVDIDFLVWNVMCGPKVLDTAKVLSSSVGLCAVATDVATGERATFRAWSGHDDLLGCLRAGASMPIVSGRPYVYRDRTYWDALLSEPIPVAVAEDDGFTHLLVLLTRPTGTAGPRMSFSERTFILPRLRAVSEALARRYAERAVHYVDLLKLLGEGRGPKGVAKALAITPGEPTVGKLERGRERLIAGARAGIRAIVDALGDGEQAHEVLGLFAEGQRRLKC